VSDGHPARWLAGAVAFVVVAGLAFWLLQADGSSSPGDPSSTRATTAAPAAGRQPPAVPTRGCEERIEGGEAQTTDPGSDLAFGPLSLGLRASYLDRLRRVRAGALDGVVPLKSIALLDAGRRATLAVPRGQRKWLRLAWEFPSEGGTSAIRLAACRHLPSLAEQREECGWAPLLACRSASTQFSGGVRIDFDHAPRDGACAAVHVWIEGQPRPLRKRLFEPAPGTCRGVPL
jgi:hypothetical protein